MKAKPHDIEEIKQQLQEEIRTEYHRHFPNITFLLFLAYFWETAEHYMELSSWWLFERMFESVEFWGNRLITDGICMIIGYGIAFRFRKTKFYGAKFLAIYLICVTSAWLFSHDMEALYSTKLEPFWGSNDTSFFDLWSFVHIATGTVFGSFVIWWNKRVPEALEEKW